MLTNLLIIFNAKFFFSFFTLYFIGSWFIILMGYLPFKTNFITFTNNAKKQFESCNIAKINFFHKGYNFFYLFSFCSNVILNLFLLGIFVWIYWTFAISRYYFIPYIINFILLNFYIIWQFLKYWHYIKKNGYVAKKIAIKNFEEYKNSIIILKAEIKINIYNNIEYSSLSLIDKPFNFNQWRYKRKFVRLMNKNYSYEKMKIKQLNFFIRYLKLYSNFFEKYSDKIIQDNPIYYFSIDNETNIDLDDIKLALINNFFYWLDNCKNY